MPATILQTAVAPAHRFREGVDRRLICTEQLMTAVLDFENGPWDQADPYHSHPHEQITYIAEGELIFLAEGDEPRHLKAGDLFAVPSNLPHSIQLLSKRARLIDCFHPIREDFLS